MKTSKSRKILIVTIVCAVVILWFFIMVLPVIYGGFKVMNWLLRPVRVVTTDLADYGKYPPDSFDDHCGKMVPDFFPEKIEDSFSDVRFSYRSEKWDTIAFEMVLEFRIEDKEAYEAHVQRVTHDLEGAIFLYDPSFMEYSLSNALELTSPYDEEDAPNIRYAKVWKILCNESEQSIIYMAMGVFDGCAVDTDFLSVFFNRFQIDPMEYVKTAYPRIAQSK